MKKTLIALFVLLTIMNGVTVYRFFNEKESIPPPVKESSPEVPVTPIPENQKPENYTVSPLPVEYINYTQIRELMQKWNSEAP